jgi:hypothetical protein
MASKAEGEELITTPDRKQLHQKSYQKDETTQIPREQARRFEDLSRECVTPQTKSEESIHH